MIIFFESSKPQKGRRFLVPRIVQICCNWAIRQFVGQYFFCMGQWMIEVFLEAHRSLPFFFAPKSHCFHYSGLPFTIYIKSKIALYHNNRRICNSLLKYSIYKSVSLIFPLLSMWFDWAWNSDFSIKTKKKYSHCFIQSNTYLKPVCQCHNLLSLVMFVPLGSFL